MTKLNAAGSAFVYSTYLGGAGRRWGQRYQGRLFRQRTRRRIHRLDGLPDGQSHTGRERRRHHDAFVTKFNAAGSALTFSTYLGGSGADSGFALAVDSAGNIYVAGITTSTNFPTLNPVQAANGGRR